MDRKKIIMISGGVTFVIVFLLIGLWLINRSPAQPLTKPPVYEATPAEVQKAEEEVEKEQATRVQSASVQSLAKTFVERYGSFSTESDYANLKDVLSLMSVSLAAETQVAIDNAQPMAGFYGITTRVISIQVEKMDEEQGTAKLVVSTQREESKETPQNISVKYQAIELDFIKESGVWKIDQAVWQTE